MSGCDEMQGRQADAVRIRAVLAIAAVKASLERFESGDVNAMRALDEVMAAVEAFRSEASGQRRAA